MWIKGWRDRLWGELDRPWDIIIVGGGITGAGILREATHAGLSALLLEGQDFASGTSSRSSKLVHGGLRYLRNAQIRTTIASVHERERLLGDGRGLISPLGFVYVCYQQDKVPLWALGLGLAVYDLLGLRWGHKKYQPDALVKLVPNLERQGLKGGYRYFDAQTDDARLVLRVIREAVRDGGHALNYALVGGLLRSRDGRVHGVAVEDTSGEGESRSAEVKGTVIVNATGYAADTLRAPRKDQRHLRLLRGSHLIFPANRFPLLRAVSYGHPVDGRPVFAIPWEGVTLFGTTDVDHQQHGLVEPAIDDSEVDYLLTAINHGFSALSLSETDIQATFAGIRAVVNTGRLDPSRESREHVVWRENGLLTVTGGKLTTFRVMARDALKAVRSWFPDRPRFGNNQALDEIETLTPLDALGPRERMRLIGRYGHEAPALIAAAERNELSPVAELIGNRVMWAELRWAARAEGVVHLDDLLLRRVRLGLLLPQGAITWIEGIRSIVQEELDWSDQRWAVEVDRYIERYHQAYSPNRRATSNRVGGQ